jgi:hypothetical protein
MPRLPDPLSVAETRVPLGIAPVRESLRITLIIPTSSVLLFATVTAFFETSIVSSTVVALLNDAPSTEELSTTAVELATESVPV